MPTMIAAPLCLAATLCVAHPPETARLPVTDTYHGVTVVDDYRWLEEWNDPAVQAWSDAQNTYARSVLDELPGVDAIRARVTAIYSAETVSHSAIHAAGDTMFAMRRQPPKQQPFLVVMRGQRGPDQAEALVDPNTLDPTGGTSIDWYVPSPDGTLVAVSMSSGGSESGDVHVIDVATGKQVHEVVPRVNGGTAGGSLSWAPDGKGFYYTRYPRAGERPEVDMNFFVQTYFHQLGASPDQDRYEIGKEFPRIAEVVLETCMSQGPARGTVLASVQKGDGGEFMHFLRAPSSGWSQVTEYEDRVVQARLGPVGDLFLISRKTSPRGGVLRLAPGQSDLAKARTIVAPDTDAIVSGFFDSTNWGVSQNFLYLTYQLGGPSEIRVFTHEGARKAGPKLSPVSGAGGIVSFEGLDHILFFSESYLAQPTWAFFNSAKPGEATETAFTTRTISGVAPDMSPYEVVREMATSRDGTKVPVNIIRKKGLKLDSSYPALLTGYGGYGVNITPGYSRHGAVLLEHGFVLAEANIRGGGEFGDEWHLNGNLTKKQNVFDDFAAACALLVERGYTTRQKLAVEGGSNGGLLMGALFTQHPELAACVVSHVGIYDMLRVELSPNGAFNIPEFGTVTDPAQFKALHAYSPYHHVSAGTKYPPVLLLTGANDPRVDPMQSRKMTARMQAAGATTLLRTSANSGHGGGTALSERIEQEVDITAFLLHELGLTARP